MKKILSFFVGLTVLMFSVNSCEGYFTVDLSDQANLDEIFSQSTTVHNYLAHLYSYIPVDENMQYKHGWVVPRSDEAQFSWYQWVYYILYKTGNYSSSSPTSSQYFNFFDDFYIGINQTSLFIEYIVKDHDDSEIVKKQMVAEARFLRAYYYFCVFRQYGPTFIWGDRRPDESITSESIDRHTVDENIDFMVSELDKAIADLPIKVSDTGEAETAWRGRATKGAAMALKARILLYAASPLYNGCELYKGTLQNKDGKFLFPQSYDAKKWEKAAQAAKDIIDLDEYSLCKRTPTGDTFKDGAASYQSIYFEPWNEETIFGWWRRYYYGYDYLGGAGEYIACSTPPGHGLAGYGGISPSLKLVDAYAMYETGRYPVTGYDKDANGLDYSKPIIDAASGYKATGFTEGYKQPLDADWAPEFKAHNSCIGREPRYYACIVPNGFYWPNKNGYDGNFRFTCYNNANCSSYWRVSGDCARVGYAWRKLYKADNPLKSYTDYTSLKYVYPAFRLAEVYLNYAEACNEMENRNEDEAVKYLNMVRNRSGLNNIEEAYPEVKGNQALLRWLIRQERMIEFSMDAMRHYDACRWMIAKDEYNCDTWTLHVKAENYEDSYERVSDDFTGDPNKFTDRDYLFPFSSDQLAKMTSLTQNPGF